MSGFFNESGNLSSLKEGASSPLTSVLLKLSPLIDALFRSRRSTRRSSASRSA